MWLNIKLFYYYLRGIPVFPTGFMGDYTPSVGSYYIIRNGNTVTTFKVVGYKNKGLLVFVVSIEEV